MRKRVAAILALALAGGLLAVTGGAGAQEEVPLPNQSVTPCWILSGEVVDGKLSFELKPEDDQPAGVEVADAEADAVWNPNEGVIEFKVAAELVFEGDGGGFAGFGVHGVLEEGEDFDIRESEWRTDGLEARVELAGIVTPSDIGEIVTPSDLEFALRIELPAIVK